MFDSQEEKMQALLQQQRQQSLHANVLQTLSPQQLDLLRKVTCNGGFSAGSNSEPSHSSSLQDLVSSLARTQRLRTATRISQQDPSDSLSLQDMESQLQRAQRALNEQSSRIGPSTSSTDLRTLGRKLEEFPECQCQLESAHPPNAPLNQLLGQLNELQNDPRGNRPPTSVSEWVTLNRRPEAPNPAHVLTLQRQLSQVGDMLTALQQQQLRWKEQLSPGTVGKLLELRQQMDTILLHERGRDDGPSPERQGAKQSSGDEARTLASLLAKRGPRGGGEQGKDRPYERPLNDSYDASQKALLHLLAGVERQSHDGSDVLGSILAERNPPRNSLAQHHKESFKEKLPPTTVKERESSGSASVLPQFHPLKEELISRHKDYIKSTLLKNQMNSQLGSSGHLNNNSIRRPTSHILQAEDSLWYSNNNIQENISDQMSSEDSSSRLTSKKEHSSTSTCSSSQPLELLPDCTTSDLIVYISNTVPESLSLEFLTFCNKKSQESHQGFNEVLAQVLMRLHLLVKKTDDFEESGNTHLHSRASNCILEIEKIKKSINLSTPGSSQLSLKRELEGQQKIDINPSSSSLSKSPATLDQPMEISTTRCDDEIDIVGMCTPHVPPKGVLQSFCHRQQSPPPLGLSSNEAQSSRIPVARAAGHHSKRHTRPLLPCARPLLKRPREDSRSLAREISLLAPAATSSSSVSSHLLQPVAELGQSSLARLLAVRRPPTEGSDPPPVMPRAGQTGYRPEEK